MKDDSPTTPETDNPHRLLQRLIGNWEGRVRTWFEADNLADDSEIHASISAVLGGRFISHEYVSSLQGLPLAGQALLGYNQFANRWEMSWIDTFHTSTSIMFSISSVAATPEIISVLGHYPDGQGGPEWGWRTDYRLKGDDTLLVTHYNITPDGAEAKAVEMGYRRAMKAAEPKSAGKKSAKAAATPVKKDAKPAAKRR